MVEIAIFLFQIHSTNGQNPCTGNDATGSHFHRKYYFGQEKEEMKLFNDIVSPMVYV
jgi:hypothetical protein